MKHPFSEPMLGALDLRSDPSAAQTHFQDALTALRQPPHAFILTAFERAEVQALALALLDRGREAAALFRGAVHTRSRAEVYQRKIYELLTMPGGPGAVHDLIAIWREIIAEDSVAAGPWGPPPAAAG